jgi:hypothetical protein
LQLSAFIMYNKISVMNIVFITPANPPVT